jgi:hypothetical protein
VPGSPASRVQLSTPADVLAAVPHLFGFHPASSFVVIGAAGRRQQVELAFRYDLPEPPDAPAAAGIASHAAAVLSQRRITTVIGAGYGPGRLVTPVADAFAAAARGHGLRVADLLRVEHGRFWSYTCGSVACCPPEGTRFDYSSQPAAAAMTAAGLAAYPDRAALERTLAPVSGADAEAMNAAIQRACDRAAAMAARASRAGGRHPWREVIAAGRTAAVGAISTYRSGGRITDADTIAWILVTLAHLAVRDDAWARMIPEHRDAHLRLWADLARHAPGPWLPAPAALLAFTAWQAGDGALANIALERALAADPGYSLARLLQDILTAGVPPSQARLPMTPEQVAAGYARAERDERAAARRRARRR